jgi:glycosyltransferase involved in cell wall biosynthesis
MREPIDVVHIITRLDMGGSAQNTLLTLLHLDPNRYRLTLIKGPNAPYGLTSQEETSLRESFNILLQRGIRIIELPGLVRRVDPLSDLKVLLELVRILRTLHADGVHTHTSKAGFIGRLAAKMVRVPWIVHTPHGHVFQGHFGPALVWVFLQIERFASRITDHLIALTSGEAQDYIRLGVMDAHKISVIPSGIFLDRFAGARYHRDAKRKDLGLSDETIIVGFVGWLWPIKGLRFLMNAMVGIMHENPGVSLMFVGQGSEESALREQAAIARLESRVLFLGWRPDVHEIMPCFDLLVLPSLNEGMGRVLAEGMAAGLPIVATRVGGIPDLVKHGENGLLVPPGDAPALREAIRSLIQDPNRRKAMSQKGEAMCHPFSVENMVNQISEVYERLQKQRN